nr:unnamed protein product [Digitaria exilis]
MSCRRTWIARPDAGGGGGGPVMMTGVVGPESTWIARPDAGGGGGGPVMMTGVVGPESSSSWSSPAASSPATTGRSSSRSLSLPAMELR